MVIALVHNARLPVPHYGGTERVIWWLAKALCELGHQVILVAEKGSQCPFAQVVAADFSKPVDYQVQGAQIFHFFHPPFFTPQRPFLVTIGGNGRPGEAYFENTVFVSRNHAQRHGASCYVYNGVDPAEYHYAEDKLPYLLFLAKASWKVKNVSGAIQLARIVGRDLRIIGGRRWLLRRWRGVQWEGMLGGEKKAAIISKAQALLFPVIWHEPFGLAVIEALVSGTPVIASPFGSLPELVPKTVGFLCREREEFLGAVHSLSTIKSADCRAWVIENFHYHGMARSYLSLYEKVLGGEKLNAEAPRFLDSKEDFCLGI